MGTGNSRRNPQTSRGRLVQGPSRSRIRTRRLLRPQVETVEQRILLSPGVVSSFRTKAHAAILPVRASGWLGLDRREAPVRGPANLWRHSAALHSATATPTPTARQTRAASRPTPSAETAYLVPGQPGETIQATFALQDRNAAFRNEFGLSLVTSQ
jgi:hypothetical protein